MTDEEMKQAVEKAANDNDVGAKYGLTKKDSNMTPEEIKQASDEMEKQTNKEFTSDRMKQFSRFLNAPVMSTINELATPDYDKERYTDQAMSIRTEGDKVKDTLRDVAYGAGTVTSDALINAAVSKLLGKMGLGPSTVDERESRKAIKTNDESKLKHYNQGFEDYKTKHPEEVKQQVIKEYKDTYPHLKIDDNTTRKDIALYDGEHPNAHDLKSGSIVKEETARRLAEENERGPLWMRHGYEVTSAKDLPQSSKTSMFLKMQPKPGTLGTLIKKNSLQNISNIISRNIGNRDEAILDALTAGKYAKKGLEANEEYQKRNIADPSRKYGFISSILDAIKLNQLKDNSDKIDIEKVKKEMPVEKLTSEQQEEFQGLLNSGDSKGLRDWLLSADVQDSLQK